MLQAAATTIISHEWLMRSPRIKGRSRISMIWVPPFRFDPYCGVTRYPYNINLPQVSTQNKKFLQKLWTNWKKSKNHIFSINAQPILMDKIYVIEDSEEVMQKIQEPIPLIRMWQKKLL